MNRTTKIMSLGAIAMTAAMLTLAPVAEAKKGGGGGGSSFSGGGKGGSSGGGSHGSHSSHGGRHFHHHGFGFHSPVCIAYDNVWVNGVRRWSCVAYK